MTEEDPDKMTSQEIFYQFCGAKQKKALEFLKDYMLYELNVINAFDDEKYKKLLDYILDFMIGAETVFNFNVKFLINYSGNLEKDNYKQAIYKDLGLEDDTIIDFFYNYFIGNISNFEMIKNKHYLKNDIKDIKNIKTNIQMDMGHSKINMMENSYKVLLKLEDNSNNKNGIDNIYEISDTNLMPLINKLKEIYQQIKD